MFRTITHIEDAVVAETFDSMADFWEKLKKEEPENYEKLAKTLTLREKEYYTFPD